MSHVQDAGPSSEGWRSQRIQSLRFRRTGVYVLGVASGLAVALFAPLLRPAARSAMRGGILIGRHGKKVASSLREEFEDLAAEARADLEREENGGIDQRDT